MLSVVVALIDEIVFFSSTFQFCILSRIFIFLFVVSLGVGAQPALLLFTPPSFDHPESPSASPT